MGGKTLIYDDPDQEHPILYRRLQDFDCDLCLAGRGRRLSSRPNSTSVPPISRFVSHREHDTLNWHRFLLPSASQICIAVRASSGENLMDLNRPSTDNNPREKGRISNR